MAINDSMHGNSEIEFLNTVGFQFSTIRTNRNMSQMDVIKKMEYKHQYKMSRQHLSELEGGKGTISLYEAVLLCDIYNTTLEDVLIDYDVLCKFKTMPPYRKRLKPEMSHSDIRHLATEMETQLETIYNRFREWDYK